MSETFIEPGEGSKYKIHVGLENQLAQLERLRPYARNARQGNTDLIAESLQVNGQYKPIVVNRGHLTGRPNEVAVGNHTYAAALELGWTHLAVTWIDVDEDGLAKIVVVDNMSSDQAGYDNALLAALLEDLPDYQGTGVDDEYVAKLLAGLERDAALPIDVTDPIEPPPEANLPKQAKSREVILVYPLEAENGRTHKAFGVLVSRAKTELRMSGAATVSEIVFAALALAAGPLDDLDGAEEPLPPLPGRRSR